MKNKLYGREFNTLSFINSNMNKKTIEELREEQDTTKGATDWFRLEEEIQELLDEEEVK